MLRDLAKVIIGGAVIATVVSYAYKAGVATGVSWAMNASEKS